MHYPTRWWTYHLVQTYNPINVELENNNEENTLKMLVEGISNVYITKRDKERKEIKKALNEDILQHNFKYFNNFVVINNKTYNGWTKDMINLIADEIVQEYNAKQPKDINIDDFEFEEV